jgi:hypothetical protein
VFDGNNPFARMIASFLDQALGGGRAQPAAQADGEMPVEAIPVFAGDPRELAGRWAGVVTVRSRKMVNGCPQEETGQLEFPVEFDPEGRPVWELAPGRRAVLAQVGQSWNLGRTQYTVTDLCCGGNGCRFVIEATCESIRRYSSVAGPQSPGCESSSSRTVTTVELVREGPCLRLRWYGVTHASSALRVLEDSISDREESELLIEGVLSRQ